MMGGYGMMAGLGWLGMLAMLLLWGGTIALVVWGVSSLFPADNARGEAGALEILRRRYARGEISHDEYLQASATLRLDEPER